MARHTYNVGASNGNSKLDDTKVKAIIRLYQTDLTLSQREIGERFGVRGNTVSRIISGEIWQHVWHELISE